MNDSRWRVALAALFAAVLIAAGINYTAAVSMRQASGDGHHTFCLVDGSGYCTVTHKLGYTPDGVVVTADRIGQLGSTDQFTATSFRARFWWYEPGLFAAGTRIDFSWVPGGPAAAPSPSPTATVSTPPATTPPATTPPATTPPTTGTSPAQTCTSGQTIGEGAGASFFEPNGQEYFVHNNNWNDNYGGSHTIVACSYDKWYVTTSIPAHQDNAVEAYPNVHRDYNDAALSNIQSARFAAKAPACTTSLKYNVAFDIWIGSGFSNELMIWTENCNQRPAGNQVGTTVIGGKTYEVWKSGSGAGGIFTYVSTPRQLFGTMPLASFFADLNSRGWISGAQTTWQVDFGVETVTTSGTSQRFDFTDFFIND